MILVPVPMIPPPLDTQTLNELRESLSPVLSAKGKQQLLNTLISFPDIFDKGLGHASTLSRHINTGSSAPIRQYPKLLPLRCRDEID